MRVVIQRVSQATVTVNNEITGSINKGLLVLVGFEAADDESDLSWMSSKITQLRIFDDADGVMNLSVKDIKGNLLLVSQFTLHAATKKGNRPSYVKAAAPAISIPLYESFITHLTKQLNQPIQTGVFGADMKVALVNDGPVTITIDSRNKE